MMATGSVVNMPGWDSWMAKITEMVDGAPQVAVNRVVAAWRTTMLKGAKAETQRARIGSEKVKRIALRSIGHSARAVKGTTQKAVKVGFGAGKQGAMPAGQKLVKGVLKDAAGKRDVYRRFKTTKSKRVRWSVGRAAIQALTSKRSVKVMRAGGVERKRQSKRLFGRVSERMTKRILKSVTRRRTVLRTRKMRGVGLSKRNIHWAVFGTVNPRWVKNWLGTGMPHQVGRFRPYLAGIMDDTLKRNGPAALAACDAQMNRTMNEIMAGKKLPRRFSTGSLSGIN